MHPSTDEQRALQYLLDRYHQGALPRIVPGTQGAARNGSFQVMIHLPSGEIRELEVAEALTLNPFEGLRDLANQSAQVYAEARCAERIELLERETSLDAAALVRELANEEGRAPHDRPMTAYLQYAWL